MKSDSPAETRLHRFTSELVDPALEDAFRRWSWDDQRRWSRLSIALGGVFMALLAPLDVKVLASPELWISLAARAVLVCGGAVAFLAIPAAPPPRPTYRPLEVWSYLAALAIGVVNGVRPASYTGGAVVNALAVMAFFVLLPNRVVPAALGAGSVALAYAGRIVACGEITSAVRFAVASSYAFTMVLSFVASRWMHLLRRTQFLQLVAEQDAKRQAEAASRAKSVFLATMSHEVRTPLHGLLTCVELLSGSKLDEEQREYVELIRYSARGMVQLLDEILDLSRAENGEVMLAPSSVDLRTLARELTEFVRPRALSRACTLALSIADDVPPRLVVDAKRIRQVLSNLLENAIKFSEPGAIEVDVRALRVASGKATLRFAVTDRGPGIAEGARSAVFQPFVQVSLPRGAASGSGLGLAICKTIVDAMGGTIGIEAGERGGSRFWFEVELPIAEPGDEAPPQARARPGRSLSLLVVEDDVVSQHLAARLLAKEGHHVTVASSGLEAVHRARERVFDAVLMDIWLPGVDGKEAVRRIRALPDPAHALVPVIATTAHVMREQHASYLEAGFSAVLSKPIDVAVLRETLALAERTVAPPLPPARAGEPPLVDEGVVASHAERIGIEPLREIARGFLASTEAARAALETAVLVGDRPRVAHLAHRLAGAAANLGLAALAAASAALEAAGRSGEDLAAAHAVVDEAIARALPALARTLRLDAGEASRPDPLLNAVLRQ